MAKSSFMQLIKNAVKFVIVAGTFFLFGYLELQYRCGFVMAVLVGLYLFRNGARVVSALLVIGNLIASYFSIKPLVVLSFLVLNCALFFTEKKSTDDTKVILRPYESEVRNILFRNEPARLHTVDALLDEHEGREKELIYKLTKQYENGTPKKTPSKGAKTPTRAESTLVRESPSVQSQPSPREELWRMRSPTQNSQNFNQNDQNTPVVDATVATTVSRIKNILRVRDPALFKSVDRMLEEYQGREEDLLQEVQQEYGSQDDNYEDRARQASLGQTSPLRQPSSQAQAQPRAQTQQEEWYPSHGSYRTLDGRPAARVSLDRGFVSPYSQYSNNATPVDMHSVESVRGGSERIAPFSPRVVSIPRNTNYSTNTNTDYDYTTNTNTTSAYREELAQAPYNTNYASNANNTSNDDTPRYHSTTTAQPYTNTTNANTNTQAYRNSVIHQAQEDARREMQARIDARWGSKPTSNNNGGNSGNSGSVQQRRGYNYGEN